MKKSLYAFFALLIVNSCGETNKKQTEKEPQEESKKEVVQKKIVKISDNSTFLCKINGEDWGYTEASGIVSRHKKTGKRTAIITFKKKLDKGSESIQLYYDGDSFDLEKASAHLKFPKKGGGMVSGIYALYPDTRDQNPNSDMSGKLDLSDPTEASGNAELINFNIRYEKDLLDNPDDAIITATGLKFNGIGYSDVNKAFEGLSK